MNRLVPFSILLALSFVLGSCSSLHMLPHKKKRNPPFALSSSDSLAAAGAHQAPVAVLGPFPDTVSAAPDTAGTARRLLNRVSPLFAHRFTYTTFACKARVSFESPNDSKEFTANIRIKKDTAIWVAISALGLQVARVYITPDSLFMVVPLQREVTKISLAQVAKVLPAQVDFKSLQNLIVGDPLRNGNIDGALELGTSFLLMVSDTSYLQRLNYGKSDSLLTTDQVNTRDPQGPQAIINLKDYQTMDGHKVSTSRNVLIVNGVDHYTLDMDIKDGEFDKPVEMPFSIPKAYKVKGAE